MSMLLGHFHAWLVMHHHKHLKIQQCCFSKKKEKKNSTMLESENKTIASKLKTLQIIIIGKKEKEKEKKKSPLHYSVTTNTTLNFTPKIDTYGIKNIYKREKKRIYYQPKLCFSNQVIFLSVCEERERENLT